MNITHFCQQKFNQARIHTILTMISKAQHPVLSANRFDFGLFGFHKVSHFTSPPPPGDVQQPPGPLGSLPRPWLRPQRHLSVFKGLLMGFFWLFKGYYWRFKGRVLEVVLYQRHLSVFLIGYFWATHYPPQTTHTFFILPPPPRSHELSPPIGCQQILPPRSEGGERERQRERNRRKKGGLRTKYRVLSKDSRVLSQDSRVLSQDYRVLWRILSRIRCSAMRKSTLLWTRTPSSAATRLQPRPSTLSLRLGRKMGKCMKQKKPKIRRGKGSFSFYMR